MHSLSLCSLSLRCADCVSSLRVAEVVPAEAAAEAVRAHSGMISREKMKSLNVTTMNPNSSPRRSGRSSGLLCARIFPTVSVSLVLEGRS